MDRVLVLGGSGFLGLHLVRRLASGGHRVVSAGRTPLGDGPGAVGGVDELALDLCDGGALERALEAVRPGLVLCAAALARAEECELHPSVALRINAEAPGEIARWCARRGARLVHVSTDLVFGLGRPAGERYAESDPPAPLHVYGASKAAGERAVLEGFPDALVVRLPLLFGESFGRALGASDALLVALARGTRPRLFTDEWRTPLEVSAAADALVELAESAAAGLLHVAGPDRIDRYELGRRVLESRGFPAAEIQAAIEPGIHAELELYPARPADVSLDASRAVELLGRPLPGLRESLEAARGPSASS